VSFFYFMAFSQDPGIRFEKGLSWQDILSKAKTENKYVFVDCYTTWCGPCKYMARNIFPLKETGDALNPKFISVGMQLDTTAHDSDTVKGEYADAHMIMTNYDIRAFPTYLFFNPQGILVHRALGSTDAAHFISFTEDALHEDRQYYSLISKYRNRNNKDSMLLESLGHQAIDNGDPALADSVLNDWFSIIKNPYTKERLEMIAQITRKSTDPGFDLFYKNTARIDKIKKPDFAETVVMNVIIKENQSITALFKTNADTPEWSRIAEEIKTRYGSEYAHRSITWVKVPYYKKEKNWNLYGSSLVAYLKEYGAYLEAQELNNYAWEIFEYCTGPDDLAVGLSCSNRSITANEKPNPGFMDTYANLLYKSGRTAEAIAKETEALNLSEPSQRQPLQESLDKMKAGQKTWD